MARTPLETTQDEQIINPEDAPGLPAVLEDAHQLSLAHAGSLQTMDAFIALGRIQSSQFHVTVAEKLIVETAINIRQTKKYKGLPYKKENGEVRHVATFEEFCEVFLGKSYRRVMELIKNYNMLGPELYEQAEKLGFRQRDYNALKALPEDDRKLIAQAIEEENIDKALDIMQEMAAKHSREKAELVGQVEELSKNVASKDAVIAKKIQTNTELEQEMAKLRLDRPISAHIDWPAACLGYIDQITNIRKILKANIGALEVVRAEVMAINPESESEEASLAVAREILARELVSVHNECLDMIEAIGEQFDKSLGMYADERIELVKRAIGE